MEWAAWAQQQGDTRWIQDIQAGGAQKCGTIKKCLPEGPPEAIPAAAAAQKAMWTNITY